MIALGTALADECVVLAHGGGGELMQRLIREHFVAELGPGPATGLTDGAVLAAGPGRLVFTTDSYVVTPLEFPGGDIGRLAVCGTLNDLAVMGARPAALSLGLILEEGLPLTTLDRIIASVAQAARDAGVPVVTGDTKVIERRAARSDGDGPGAGGRHGESPGMFINTAGVGWLAAGVELGVERVAAGDCILINGPIAEHGLTIMAQREGLQMESPLMSDVAALHRLTAEMLASGAQIRFLRDPTRGGLAGVLADIRDGCGATLEVDEAAIPMSPAARHAAEWFGLDPLTVANEGKLVAVVAAGDCARLLAVMRANRLGGQAACIGRVTAARPGLVELCTRMGGRRVVDRPYGEELPRIC